MNRLLFPLYLIVLWIINFPLWAVEYSIIYEDESELQIQLEDNSKFSWEQVENYPGAESYFSLGVTNSVSLSANFAIPFWAFTVALPAPLRPTIQLIRARYEEIQLPAILRPEDVQTINQKRSPDFVDIGYFRFNPAGDLVIFPIKCLSSNRIQILRSAIVVIRYAKKSTIENHKSAFIPKQDKRFDQVFINSKYASQWYTKSVQRFRKPSTLPQGKWYKITVRNDGIYTINYQQLKDLGLAENEIDVNRIFLYSNSTSGREIDNTPGLEVPENLIENSRLIDNDQDGLFNSMDIILFYGRATSGVDATSTGELIFRRNVYSFDNYYWLLIADHPGAPKNMVISASSAAAPDTVLKKTETLIRHEAELVNFLRSGKDWYGKKFNGSGSSVSEIFQLPPLSRDDPAGTKYSADLVVVTRGATNEVTHNYKLSIGSSPTALLSWSGRNFSVTPNSTNVSLEPNANNMIKIGYTSNVNSAIAYLDYIEIKFKAPLRPLGQSIDFWGPPVSGIVEYQLSGLNLNDPILLDITQWSEVKIQNKIQPSANNSLTFRQQNDKGKRSHFLIAAATHFKTPEQIEAIDNPYWNALRNETNAAQYIIITTEEFQNQANLLAKMHREEVREKDRLSTLVVFQDQILREFNADIVDPNAIRLFLKYALENWIIPPEYVLLLGDGTFDYRHIESNVGDVVLTYQVESASGSDNGFNSYTADSRFTYVNGADQKMDLAIGRIPARTAAEAQAVIDKIRSYVLEPIYGDWRSRITLVADDPERPNTNEKYHTEDTENYIFKYLPATFDVKKIYLLEYPEIQDATTYGVKKPDASTALFAQIQKGTTLINYFGHGSPTVWTQEYILEMTRDMGNIKTGMKLPFWIAATCSWGQFDDITIICMPEALILEPGDGGIGTLAPTRATYGRWNAYFINDWIQCLFTNANYSRIRIGSVMQIVSSTGGGDTENNEKYTLFADPALYLALPYEDVVIEPLTSDTLKTLSNITVEGYVSNPTNSHFAGEGILKLYDSERYVTRYYIDSNKIQQSLSYQLPGELLYNGKVNISSGQFSSRFFIPKDINYANNKGKITIHGWDSATGSEVGGYHQPLYYSGSESVSDTIGPQIVIGLDDRDFRSSDLIPPQSQLAISLNDPLGINIAGKMGHDIVMVIDDEQSNSYKITEYFSYDTDSDTSGKVIYPLPELSPRIHKISITAWDNANNPATESSKFNLLASADFQLQQVVNFPNPFKGTTDITFYITHSARIECTIYTVRGLKIKTISHDEVWLPGFNYIHWDGNDDFGDRVAKGIYLYKIKAISLETNVKNQFIGKMVKTG